MPPNTAVAGTKWFYRAGILGGIGALLHALFTTGYVIPFAFGCSCFCPPPTNTVAWIATLFLLYLSALAALLTANALTKKEPFSLENLWFPAVMTAVGFLIAGGVLIGASIKLAGYAPPHTAALTAGAALLALSAPVSFAGRARVGPALGAAGAALIGVAGISPLVTSYGPFMVRTSWSTVVAATTQISLIGHPFILFSVAAVLALLATGAPKKVVTASAIAPPALLAATSFMMVANLVMWELRYPIYETVPEALRYSTLIYSSLKFIGPTLLGMSGAIAATAIILVLRKHGSKEVIK